MKSLTLCLLSLIHFGLHAQQIQFLDLPSFFDREFEVSGLTGNDTNLYLAAERCGKIFVINKENMTHVHTIDLNMDTLQDDLEIEGLSIYKDYLLMTDESKGKLFSLNFKTNKIREVKINGKDISSFQDDYGVEGIAVDETSNIVYVLRERNKDHQSEIYTFHITDSREVINLKYKSKTLVQHKNSKWRYSGLAIDKDRRRLLCLKSFHFKDEPSLDKREIEYIPYGSLSNTKSNPSQLLSLTDEIYFLRHSFAVNVEGIFYDGNSIFVVSDNGDGNSRDCDDKASKTVMIRILLD